MEDKCIKYTVVSDPGVDDVVALLLLYRLSSAVEHNVISTFGNIPEKYASRNLKEFVFFIAPHWSYSHGANVPLQPLEHQWPTYFHGEDGVWNIHPPTKIKVDKIEEQKGLFVSEHFISLGPMTEIYNIIRQKSKISGITIMGGAFDVIGNETKYAETNIAFDPDAASYCFDNLQGINVRVVPLDVTKRVFWTKEKVLTIPENRPYKVWAKKMLLTWFENYGDKHKANFDLHDPLAIYSIFSPRDFKWELSGVKVITEGVTRGQTILAKNNPFSRIALNINSPINIADKIFDLIFKG